MVDVAESAGASLPIQSALDAGIATISALQTVVFTQYVRNVLPLDGYVFWIANGVNLTAQGSLHYSVDLQSNEDETLAVNQVVFSTKTLIKSFNDPNPQALWIATVDGAQYTFSQRGKYYEQAGIYHYSGNAIYPALATQLVNNVNSLPQTQIVSNSLPAWLSLVSYSPIWLQPANPTITLFPSFVVPENEPPPYGSVHIEPSQTKALQASPYLDQNVSHYQLATDHVRITLYGCTNNQVLDFIDLTERYSLDTDNIGIMSLQVMRDEKRPQTEIASIAMKKVIEYDVSYYQTRINTLTRQLINSAPVTYTLSAYPLT